MPTLRFSHVIFADDFFRSAVNGLQCHVNNRRFLRGFFDTSLKRLGLPMRDAAALSEGGAVDVARLMARLALPCTPAGWASACTADLVPLLGRDGLPAFVPGCLVIGWGLTPALQQAIDRSGAAYIDIEIDPVRFTTHLHLCARSNDAVIAEALQARRVDEEEFWNHAAALKGNFARHGAPALFNEGLRVGVFFGQSLVDLSLVSGGRTMHPASVIAPLKALAESVDLLVVKPHPCEPALHHLAPIARALPHVAWTNENSYALLSASNVAFACALSSSVLTEARYFGKAAHALVRSDRNAPDMLPARCCDWMAVGPEVASMYFMASVCGELPPASPGACPDAAIDQAFAIRWGLDAQCRGLKPLSAPEMGRSYPFTPGSPATSWLTHGWSTPESWGVWSEGEQACLVIPVPPDVDASDGSLEVRLEGARYLGGATAPSVCAIVNGELVPAQHGFSLRAEAIEFVLHPAVHGAPGSQVLVIPFAIGDPQRPCDASDSLDTRRLGFSLKNLQVSARAPAARSGSAGRSAPGWVSSVLRAWS